MEGGSVGEGLARRGDLGGIHRGHKIGADSRTSRALSSVPSR
jgi:hypothetical protein